MFLFISYGTELMLNIHIIKNSNNQCVSWCIVYALVLRGLAWVPSRNPLRKRLRTTLR